MRILVAFVLLSTASAVYAAPPLPPAQEVLARTAAAYKQLRGYQFRVTVQTIRGGRVSERRYLTSGAQARYRVEEEGAAGELRVSDGQTAWVLDRAAGEYVKAAAGETPIREFEEIDAGAPKAAVNREEVLVVDGRPRATFVVRVVRDRWPAGVPAGTDYAMYRIDKATSAVVKAIYYVEGVTEIRLYTTVIWDRAMPESLFAFTPPASAKQVPSAPAPAVRPYQLAGASAPDFALTDITGRKVALSGLRGHVVVLDFWATWCPPCRKAMPALQKMQDELGPKGLVVLGLDVGEEAAPVKVFAKEQQYTFTLLLGAEPDVTAKYFVEAYPTTFVVDRSGRIVFRALGGGGTADLRAAVEAALDAREF